MKKVRIDFTFSSPEVTIYTTKRSMRSGVSSLNAPRDTVQCLQRLKVFENLQYIGTVSESLSRTLALERIERAYTMRPIAPSVVSDGDTGRNLRNDRVKRGGNAAFNQVNGAKA